MDKKIYRKLVKSVRDGRIEDPVERTYRVYGQQIEGAVTQLKKEGGVLFGSSFVNGGQRIVSPCPYSLRILEERVKRITGDSEVRCR